MECEKEAVCSHDGCSSRNGIDLISVSVVEFKERDNERGGWQ